MKRKIFTLLFVLSLFAILIPCTTSAEIIDSDTGNDNLTWILDDSGTLTISGKGNVKELKTINKEKSP